DRCRRGDDVRVGPVFVRQLARQQDEREPPNSHGALAGSVVVVWKSLVGSTTTTSPNFARSFWIASASPAITMTTFCEPKDFFAAACVRATSTPRTASRYLSQ